MARGAIEAGTSSAPRDTIESAAEMAAHAHEIEEEAALEAILDEIVEVLGSDFQPDDLLKIAADPSHPHHHLKVLVKRAADPAAQARRWAQLVQRRAAERETNVQDRKGGDAA